MTTRYAQTTTAIAVHLSRDNPVFGESVIEVALDDEAAGPFIVLRHTETVSEIRIDFDQLEKIVDAARMPTQTVNSLVHNLRTPSASACPAWFRSSLVTKLS